MKAFNPKLHRATTFLLTLLAFNFTTHSTQAGKSKGCGDNCFTSDIISLEQKGDCYEYKVKVSHNGSCNYELSHYNIDLGCGVVSEAYNSKGWKMELNSLDPTTGLKGLKVDDIRWFGKKDKFKSFFVKFKFCPAAGCSENPDCLSPKVAYKAGRCVYYDEIEVSCANPLQVVATPFSPSCHNGADGSIQLTITGGEAPYTILWDDGAMNSTLNNLSSGAYQYIVTDAQGEIVSDEVVLGNPELLNVSAEVVHPGCGESNSGSIALEVNGGAGAYSFLWSNDSTEKDLYGLSAGIYSVTVTDEKGCSSVGSYELVNQNTLTVSQAMMQPTCGESEFGSIELTVSGGAEPYTFAWSDGAETQNRDQLEEGFYQVTITDQQGCQVQRSYSINMQTMLNASAQITHTNCFNDPTGAIDLFVTGGELPYTFEWSNGADAEDLSGLEAGSYSVLITDAKGCQITYTANVNQREVQVFAWSAALPSCPGSEDARIETRVFFGSEPYTYEWSNGTSGPNLENIGAGDYTVTVTDANGCSGTSVVSISDPTPVQVSYSVVPQGCGENITYDVALNVFGGAGGYTYEWSNGATTRNVADLEGGTYTVTVTDANGCSITQEVVAEGDPEAIACAIINPDTSTVCNSAGNILTGEIEGAVSYQWSLTSSDVGWVITSSTTAKNIEFTTGAAGGTATFSLEVLLENGCTAYCSYTFTTCTEEEDPDGEDPKNPDDEEGEDDEDNDGPSDGDPDNEDDDGDGNEEPGDDDSDDEDNDGDKPGKSCDECFSTLPVQIAKVGDKYEYSITVNHDGDCRYDLSHFAIAIPQCAKVVSYSNSMGWKMELVNPDPKTGITGIKVDDIPSFGKDEGLTSFTVSYTLKAKSEWCVEELACYLPKVAYKAAKCVYYEYTNGECAVEEDVVSEVDVYPNPTRDYVKVKMKHFKGGEYYSYTLMNCQGKVLHRKDNIRDREFSVDLRSFKSEFFLLKVTGSGGSQQLLRVLKH